jgi:hypothetical protein
MAVAGRALRNRLIDEMGDAEALDFPAQASLARALLQANSDAVRRAFLPLWAGQATPLIRDLPAATFIDTLVAQTRGRLPSVSKKPPHGTHFCCWHFSDLTLRRMSTLRQQRSFHNRCFRELSLGNTGFDNRWLAK